ncbi:Lsg locus protein 4 [Mannheimia sp. USDA-ARS-USMARC-1261]|uniref:glycosyltransferase family 25 protein n=1 Tax=Mannheimia sp. USDA-ARS-USMARC-1261 TaxID=1432056 RepID=UPI0003E3485F|nr:glycosyltransferase family 25 protein [Mannheimia sp. USDA-ARS-USMARC-1261]AHG72753.1 Lsg locus protein 4 [Mannheimia sp. USDA-ARS-USMARC-1261]
MKKYLISLEKDVKRRELFFSQPNTLDFEIFNAINTMSRDWDALNTHFDLAKFEQHYGRKTTKGEVGCTLSHLAVYQKIAEDTTIENNDYCLVCEDDVLFTQDFQKHIEALLVQNLTADIILVGQSKIPTFDDVELEINYPTTFGFLQKQIGDSQYKYAYSYRNYFAGTVAYLIKKSTACKFLAQCSTTRPYWLADDFILFGNEFKLDVLIVRPLMAIENPVLISNLEDLRGSLNNNLFKKLVKYPLKKILAIKRNLSSNL